MRLDPSCRPRPAVVVDKPRLGMAMTLLSIRFVACDGRLGMGRIVRSMIPIKAVAFQIDVCGWTLLSG